MAKSMTMTNKENLYSQEVGQKHGCTIVVFCDDTARDVWEDNNSWLVTFPDQSTERAAEKYTYTNHNFLFQRHRKNCTGEKPRKHNITIRFEVDNFSEIHYVSLGKEWHMTRAQIRRVNPNRVTHR